MKTWVTIFFMLAGTSTFSQSMRLTCGDNEISFSNGNLDHYHMMLFCPACYEGDTSKIPQAVFKNAEEYLVKRVGANFYPRLKFYDCQVSDWEEFKKSGRNPAYADKKECDKRLKYGLQYYFTVQDSMRYYISLFFDKDGKIISPDFLPDVSKKPNFDYIIDACKAVEIAEEDGDSTKKTDNLSLEYSEKESAFVWVLESEDVYVGPKENMSFTTTINANTGKVISVKKNKIFVVCRLPSF